MGLLDFMGSGDLEDPKTLATLQLAAGLLGGRGSGMQRLSQGLLGYGQTMAQSKRAAEDAEARKMQREMQQMQLQQMQQAAAEAQRMKAAEEALRGRIPSPLGQANAVASQAGPLGTVAAANAQPKIDPRTQILHEAMQSGLVKPLDYMNATAPKAPEFKTVGDSLVKIAGNDVSEAYRAPAKPAAPTDLAKLMTEMQALPPGDPMRQVYQNAITKATTHQPGVNVTYGAPVAGVDSTTGNPVFFQPDRKGGAPAIIPGVAPPPKDVPASMREALARNEVTLGKIDKAIELADQNPNAFGLKNILGDAAMQRLDPGGVAARAMVADIAGQKIHDRSGAAVTVGEAERLKPYVPNINDSPSTVKKKLELFKSEYAAMQQELSSGASLGQATRKGKNDPSKPRSLDDILNQYGN